MAHLSHPDPLLPPPPFFLTLPPPLFPSPSPSDGRCWPAGALAKALMARSASPAPVKAAALRLAAAVVEGLNPMDRGAPAVQSEAWTMFGKAMKVRWWGKPQAATACLRGKTVVEQRV